MISDHSCISALKPLPLAKYHPIEEVFTAKTKMKSFIGLKRSLCVPGSVREGMEVLVPPAMPLRGCLSFQHKKELSIHKY